MINKTRKDWLHGAYRDRVIEVARWLAEKPSTAVPGDEYAYLHELTAEDHVFLREETAREVERILRDRREAELRERHRLLIARTIVGFKMDSASRSYDFDQDEFDAAVGKALNNTDVPVEDWHLFRDIVLTDLWPKLKMAHAELQASAFSHLRSLNVSTIAEDAVFRLDIGWTALLQRAATRIESYPSGWRARIVSSKEKLGCLVMSVDCDYSAPGCRAEVERLREEIRLISLSTCEICGNPGRLRLGGFAKTVCDKHVGVLGELRDDDGSQADPYNWQDEYPSSAAEHLKGMDPVRPRPTVHVLGEDSFGGAVSRRIEADMKTTTGREHELLFEFCGALEVSVTRAAVRPEDLDRYVTEEVGSWASVQPLSDDDKAFLHGYLRALIGAEAERSRFLDDFGSGLDMMKEAQSEGIFDDLDPGVEDGEDKTRH